MSDSETQHLNSALDFVGFLKLNPTYKLVPTTKEEVVFLVATAGGGYVLKVAGKAGVKVIRSFKSGKELDEAVAEAKKIGGKSQESKGVTNPEVQKLSNPPVPQGMTNSTFGREVIGWGSRPEGATQRLNTLTRSDVLKMQEKGLTKDMAIQWQRFYENEYARNSNNLTAKNRVALMKKIISMMN